MTLTSSRRRRLGASFAAATAMIALAAGAGSSALAADRSGPPFAEPIQMTDSLRAEIQQAVDDWPSRSGASGTSVAVVTPAADGRTPVTTYFTAGQTLQAATDNFTPEPVTPLTRFELGSETKIFTADLLAAMIADGTVSLEDEVQKYAPAGVEVPVFGEGADAVHLTLRDLATHTAALPDAPANFHDGCDGDPKCKNPRPGYTRNLLWDAVENQTLAWEPGERYLYSNFGFALLGAMLADKLHPPVEDAPPAFQESLDAAFLAALSMKSTFVERGFPGAPFAHPEYPDGGLSWLWDNNNAFVGGGGLLSTAEDMATSVRSHLGYAARRTAHEVEAMKSTLEQVTQVHWYCPTYDIHSCTQPEDGVRMGLAWQLNDPSVANVGVNWAFKNGGTEGSASDTALVPDKGVGVTAMWNRGRGGKTIELAPRLLATIMNYTAATPGEPVTPPTASPSPTTSASPSASAAPGAGTTPSGSPSPAPVPAASASPVAPNTAVDAIETPTASRPLAATGFEARSLLPLALGAAALVTFGGLLLVRRSRFTR